MGRLVALLCIVFGACVEDRTVRCGELLCPAGNVCTESMTCASPEQLAACEGLVDGDSCSALSFEAAACVDGVCQPILCGDGLRVGPEVCDDENQRSGDGCAADCRSNETCGNEVVDPLADEDCDSGIAGLSNDGCSSACTLEALTWRTLPQQSPAARYTHALAYDPETAQVLMFGGTVLFSPLGDTWFYDGKHWRQRTMVEEPPGSSGPALARDDAHRTIVMFGGEREQLFDTTWLWDGVTWTRATPAASPSARKLAAMAYDPVRGEVVLFGGVAGADTLDDTWTWNGSTWTRRAPAQSPPAGAWTMAWDATTERIVLVEESASLSPTTWVWDGAAWSGGTKVPGTFAQQLLPRMVSAGDRGVVLVGQHTSTLVYANGSWSSASAFPEGTQEHALAYDPVRDRVVLFGGRVSRFADPRNKTYEWDGATWQDTSPTISQPNPSAQLTYLPARGVVLAYDGATWIWDGHVWDQRTGTSPNARVDTALAPTRDGALLFSGSAILSGLLLDTWVWSEGVWTRRFPATSPPGRRQHAMVYDARRDRVVMFGGFDGMMTYDDTWTWDGTTWSELITTTRPPARSGHALAYDPVRERIIVYGGSSGGARLGDTWELDGSEWHEIATTNTPAPRLNTAAIYHPLRQTMIVFGGQPISGVTTEAFELDGSTWRELAPVTAASPHTNHTMTYDARHAEVLAFGGDLIAGSSNTLSALRIGSQIAPADACLDVDTDGDGLVGCEDPDCWARCRPLCPPGTSCDPMAPSCGDGLCSVLEDRRLCAIDCS